MRSHRHRPATRDPRTRRDRRARRFPLLGSLGFHALLLVVAWFSFWTKPATPAKEKAIDFMPTGGGGGHPEARDRSMRKQHRDFALRQMERLAVKGVEGPIALPEAFASTKLQPLFELPSASLSGGQGGKGAGGGRGEGLGRGYGKGGAIGSGEGNGPRSPFGMLEAPASALTGTFYNLQRNADGGNITTRWDDYHRIVHEFATSDWNAKHLDRFLQAPRKLYLTHLYMPVARAAGAPAAFGQTPDSQPAWIVVYRGTVIAPKSGKFHFVGAGDDTLVVRFNHKIVFDHGYFKATNPTAPELHASAPSIAAQAAPASPPAHLPQALVRYPTTLDWNRNLGGMAVGSEFETVEGQAYPIEILLSEGQGNLFAASLLIGESGTNPQRTTGGAPILPLFRTDLTSPPRPRSDNAPPYDPNGPVWRVTKDRVSI